MSADHSWPWVALVLLGAWHGINPGMGWLFAVAMGLQEQCGAAVWRTLLPLALGHALAIAAVLLLAALVGLAVPLEPLKRIVAVTLIGFGVYRMFRQRHPRSVGMRVGAWDLTVWSCLMASAHGAGLMVLPFVLGLERPAANGADHAAHLSSFGSPALGLLATLVHGAAYLLVTAIVAWVVYEKVGVRFLRKAWLNVDLIWATALVATGGLTILL